MKISEHAAFTVQPYTFLYKKSMLSLTSAKVGQKAGCVSQGEIEGTSIRKQWDGWATSRSGDED